MGCCPSAAIRRQNETLPQGALRLEHLDTQKSKFFMNKKTGRLWKIHTESSAMEIGQMFKNNRFIALMSLHEHILKPIQVVHVSATSIAIVMPHASEDLFCILVKPFDFSWVSDQLMGIANAIHCLHSSGRAHRDIKPENIVKHEGKLKLIDFDFCYPLSMLAHCGTPYFSCPQTMTGNWLVSVEEKSKKMDVYGFGKLIMSILWCGSADAQHRRFAFETFHKTFVTSSAHLYTGSRGQWCSIALLCLMSEPPSQIPIHLVTTTASPTDAAKDAIAVVTDLKMCNTNPVFA
jgi:serine/threonine protein kinase